MRDYKLEPPDEYDEIGKCVGCGDPILAGEKYIVFESGRRIHDHEDCAYQYCRKAGSAA